MFKFLKEKLKKAVSIFSKSAEKSSEEVKEEQKVVEKKEVREVKEVAEEVAVREEEAKEELKEEPGEEAAEEEAREEVKEEEAEEEKEEEVEEEPEEAKEEITEEEELKEEIEEELKEEIEEELEEDVKEEPNPVAKEKPKEHKKEVFEKPKEEVKVGYKKEKVIEEPKEEPKKGFFGMLKEKIVKRVISEEKFDEIFWDLEVVLMENNVAVEVIEKIKDDLKANLVDKPIERSMIFERVRQSLKNSIEELLDIEKIDFIAKVKEKKPYVICFVGINGSGKTTTMAKVAKLLQDNKLKCVFAAADTFRAASIEQLQQHADNLGIKMIRHDYGSDPAAVAFDAIKYAKSKSIDAVLIDTAGRLHSNVNLIDEMKKIIRVAKPDMTIFVGESITGNDCVEQAKKFSESIRIDGIILAKADIDEKGGAAISVSYVTGKPIIFLGTGQDYKDLIEFDKKVVLDGLGIA